ncbi:uncharacterized protein TNCV_4011131 [Trichonephila clavipes]|nr:uncharacterized protein TNCV_4011131 [Trichonephila clavipes]
MMQQFETGLSNSRVKQICKQGRGTRRWGHCRWGDDWGCVDPTEGVFSVAEGYRYRIVACIVTSSSPVPLKTRRVGQQCTLNLSRVEASSRWSGVVIRRGGASSGVLHVT